MKSSWISLCVMGEGNIYLIIKYPCWALYLGIGMTHLPLPSWGIQSYGKERCKNSKAGPGHKADGGSLWGGKEGIFWKTSQCIPALRIIGKGDEVGKGKLNSGRF